MKWKRIERDKDGYATGNAMLVMQKALPIVLYDEIDNRYDVAIKDDEIYDVTGKIFSHYAPIRFTNETQEENKEV